MNENLTEVVFILDNSGSMHGLEEDTIGGFNAMIEKQQEVDGKVLVSTVLFNSHSNVLHDRVPITDIKPMTSEDYRTGGNTALLDAMGNAIRHIKNVHKYARDEDKPAKTLFVITTDGMENSSTRYTYDDIKKLVEAQQKKGWEFLFLGANIDAISVASYIGVRANRSVNYHNDRLGTQRKYEAVSRFMSDYSTASMASVVDDSWRKELDEDFEERKPHDEK